MSRRVIPEPVPAFDYVINLESSRRPPAAADLPTGVLPTEKPVFVSEASIDGITWYRLRIGPFDTYDEAAAVLRDVRQKYPGAWIDRMAVGDVPEQKVRTVEKSPYVTDAAVVASGEAAKLMADARRAMVSGETSRAVQIYTKVLHQARTEENILREAQEFLALARERNGQIAHAKAEYQRYLDLYPSGPDSDRVRQRYNTMLASADSGSREVTSPTNAPTVRSRPRSSWNVRSFFSQYYRHDEHQVEGQPGVVNQSSIYSDLSVDARRRGDRFDFAARLTTGYRSDLMDEPRSSGNDLRLSYAYVDLADSTLGLRGRLGRQTKNTGGVLGRFDGVDLGYQLSQRIRIGAVAGQPVFSTSNDPANSRTFYGLNTTLESVLDDVDIGAFIIQQEIEGITDRSAVGAELRFFDETKSVWTMLDYDTTFAELGSVFVQGSWRLPTRTTLTTVLDRRRSPFLGVGNAVVGQLSPDISELLLTYSEEEIRQIALDRSPLSSTVSFGVSQTLSPRFQLNLNVSEALIEATPDSAGVQGQPEFRYSYYSADLVSSSLLRQGDVGILGLRYSSSDSATIYSATLDARFPIGNSWRVSPRLRVDQRQIHSDGSTQVSYIPGIKLQFRTRKRIRVEFEAGRQYMNRELDLLDEVRESWFVNIGYQFFY